MAGRWPGRTLERRWWRAQFGSPARIREWAAQELATGRLLPWFAVAYGAGVVLYFTAEREPALWAAVIPTAVFGLGAILLRRQIVPQNFVLSVIALGLFGIALGFAVATLKTSLIQHSSLRLPASGVTVAGFVELREESQHTDRFVLRVDRIDGGRIQQAPQRVRLSVKRGTAPAPGSFVEVKASLDPPLQPLEPGSYDFARDIFFQGHRGLRFRARPDQSDGRTRAGHFPARRRFRATPARRDRCAHSRRAFWRRWRHCQAAEP